MKTPFSKLTRAQKNIICNGCGFCFGEKTDCPLEKMIPEFNWTPVCNEHDYYTEVGGYLTEYLGTQLIFGSKIVMKVAESTRNPLARLYKVCIATFYFLFVLIFGVFAFHWGKPRTLNKILKSKE